MKALNKILIAILGCILVFGLMVSVMAAGVNAESQKTIEEVDKFLAEHETRQKTSFEFEHQMQMMAAAVKEKPVYTWSQEMIGKVVAFEVGNCCRQCQYYVASACINRYYDWYAQDVVAMITDGNDNYYQMNPDYVWMDECNYVNFWAVYDEIMPTIDRATRVPLQVYYWDNDDTQGAWAELVWHCQEDGCWFYR